MSNALTLPAGPFDVILADPPWAYERRGCQGCAAGQYPTMSVEAICDLPDRQIAAPDALLFLWATWPQLAPALRVVEAWGFRYITLGFDWFKTNPDGAGFRFGIGSYAKSNSEPCLLAKRGRGLRPARNDVSSVVVSPLREHSRKPEAVRNRIGLMYPTARKVELFAREAAEGFSVWGNEAETSPFARQAGLFDRGAAGVAEEATT